MVGKVYSVRGTYQFHGVDHFQVGILRIGENEKITGSVMENGSGYIQRSIRGSFERAEGKIMFSVLSSSNREVIRYNLRKTRERKKTEGRYSGHCFINGGGGTARMTLDSKF